MERASKITLDREAQVRKQAKEEALAAVEKTMGDLIPDAARLKEIREMLLL